MTPKRWKAIITYATENGPADVEHNFEEICDLHRLVERGPDWAAIIDIRVTLARNSHGRTITVEEAARL